MGDGGKASSVAREVVVEVLRSSPVCGGLWEPVPMRRSRGWAKSVVAGSGSHILAGEMSTAMSSSPPLPPPFPSNLFCGPCFMHESLML